MSDQVIRARVDEDLKVSFELACKGKDITPSQAIRQFMREYIAQHGQADLFKKNKTRGGKS